MSQKHLNYDSASGSILGFYADDVHDKIPEPNLKITEEQWQECLLQPGRRKVDIITLKIVECELPELTKEQQIDQIIVEYAETVDELIKAKSLTEALGNSTELVNQRITATIAERKEKIAAVLNS